MKSWILVTNITILVIGYPLSMLIQHGFQPVSWPTGTFDLNSWFAHPEPRTIVSIYWHILTAQSETFPNGGWSFGPLLAFAPLFVTVLLRFMPKPPRAARDVAGTFGSARFASSAERAAMAQGLELGIDPDTGRAVRIAVQGTLASIAPPRKGKTSGLLIPNLSYPESRAWGGPAVVLDSKGRGVSGDASASFCTRTSRHLSRRARLGRGHGHLESAPRPRSRRRALPPTNRSRPAT